jgi:hypothetical protein|tara:strand:+ start:173 stop:844 length:672 start_codon:yes stop_codon:yes gene_type:complete
MLHKSFYQGRQGECFTQLEKYWSEIKHEFDSQSSKTFLQPEDFSDSVRGLPDDFDDKSGDYVHGEWQALGIHSGDKELQDFNDYPMLYSMLRKFPYKTNVAIMIVGPDTKIGNHTDNEGGWRYQLCLDDGGGDQSGMHVMNLETRKQELYTWKTGEAFIFQPDIQVHNGFNRNPGERTTLLIDFFKESLYTKEKFEEYYQHYSECFEGLENLVDVYESRKQKK